MQENDFTVVHRPGRKHCNVDALSRVPCPVECTAAELGHRQRSDEVLKILLQAKEAWEQPPPGDLQHCSMKDQCLLQLWDQLVVEDRMMLHTPLAILQLVVPQADREKIILQIHGGDTGGHLGVEKTVHKVKEQYYWPGHWNDVKILQNLYSLQHPERYHTSTCARLQSVQAGYSLQLVAMDIVGSFLESESGSKYILYSSQ